MIFGQHNLAMISWGCIHCIYIYICILYTHPVYILHIYPGGFQYTYPGSQPTGRIYFWGRLDKKYLTTSQPDGSQSGKRLNHRQCQVKPFDTPLNINMEHNGEGWGWHGFLLGKDGWFFRWTSRSWEPVGWYWGAWRWSTNTGGFGCKDPGRRFEMLAFLMGSHAAEDIWIQLMILIKNGGVSTTSREMGWSSKYPVKREIPTKIGPQNSGFYDIYIVWFTAEPSPVMILYRFWASGGIRGNSSSFGAPSGFWTSRGFPFGFFFALKTL